MRRFSQRNSLVTLSDINITPLLDLAFVLLIIFVITTPLLEQGINLDLPDGGVPDREHVDPRNVRTVEVSPTGLYMMGGIWMKLDDVVRQLAELRRRNPALIVNVRADENCAWKYPMALTDRLTQQGITSLSFRTDPPRR
ncbi:MAG TPA: biopolymer transporter ExbD [Methylomirabilota bacterium]|nr:biopolymer transporter ExbD [Methylomirabilota bacterium]